jgi:hypothetical protein
MGLLWNDQAPFWKIPVVSKVADKTGYSLVPSASAKRMSQLAGLTYPLPSESSYPQAAYRFMEWALSTQVQVQQTLKGSASLRISTYDNPR